MLNEMRATSGVYFCLFVCTVDLPVCFLLFVNTLQTGAHIHSCMYACNLFQEVWKKKGLIHYFLTLIGACKRIRRGKVSDWGARKYHLGGEPSGSVK